MTRPWHHLPAKHLKSCIVILVTLVVIQTIWMLSMKLTAPAHITLQDSWKAYLLTKWNKYKYIKSEKDDKYSPQVINTPVCDSVLKGDSKQMSYIKEMVFRESRAPITDIYMANLAHNCSKFYEEMDFISIVSPSEEEVNFPIGYILTVHKNAEQVVRLLRAIYAPQNIYCIHVDSTSSFQFYNAIEELLHCFPNVFIASQLEHVVYAGFSRLQADINCMKDLIKGPYRWKYIINLCGQDFPLKTNLEIVRYLNELDGENDIPGIIPTDELHVNRIKYKHDVVVLNEQEEMQQTDTLMPIPPDNTTIFFGNAYNIYSRSFVEFVLNNQLAQDILVWMQNVYSPDEYYWVTINHLPEAPGGSTEPSWKSKARIIKWSLFKDTLYPPCQGIYQRYICVYGIGDLQWLLSQPHLFANKFDLNFDHMALKCLEEYLYNRTVNGLPQSPQSPYTMRLNDTEILEQFAAQMKSIGNAM